MGGGNCLEYERGAVTRKGKKKGSEKEKGENLGQKTLKRVVAESIPQINIEPRRECVLHLC